MTEKTFYRTTPKGLAEVAAKPGKLKPGIKGLLAAVGKQASTENMRAKFPRAGDITAAMDALANEGYIEILPAAAPTAAPAAVAELESFLSERPKEPTLQQRREAEGTISGARKLKAGYQINILNRPGKPITPRGGGGKHVILVIDSHEAEALAAARGLMQAGFDIRGAANRGEIAAALAKPPLPDLIIIDVEMRDAVGLDVLGKLHEHPEFKSTPIIVVTARAERDDIVAALAYGASGYLNKPVKPDALVRYSRDALGLP
ncbi:MAG: response regulator [Burkholderiales bacterium]|jgi:CheY-like chemotaxis protein|nr:response regulator [Burkholderiales bacterium]